MTIPSLLSQRLIVSLCPTKSSDDPLDYAITLVHALSPIDCTFAKTFKLISVSFPYWFQYSLHTTISLILLKYTTFIYYSSAQVSSAALCGKVRFHCLVFKILIICCCLHIVISILMWLLSLVCPKQSSFYSTASVWVVSPLKCFFLPKTSLTHPSKSFFQESFYDNWSFSSEFWYHLQQGFRI